MTHLAPGDDAPAFHLQDQNRNGWGPEDFRRSWLILYFYPQDDTTGCTAEACGFRDRHKRIRSADAKVVGVSPDTHDSHSRFVDKYDLPFTLLADPAHEAADAYGVWVSKNHNGKAYMGIARTTFLIDPKGKIAKVYTEVEPEGHADAVLADLAELQGVEARAR